MKKEKIPRQTLSGRHSEVNLKKCGKKHTKKLFSERKYGSLKLNFFKSED